MRKLLILICFAVASGAAQQSIRGVDWMNFSFPLQEVVEKAGLRSGCRLCSQVIDVLEAQIKRRPATGQPRYSYRNATIGSTLAARRAGI